ncbi:MAG: MlaD family protein [Rhodoblastus sp.]|jgi:phospholipid/cholesterol/gamma-HCH transport system substrate-binding protein
METRANYVLIGAFTLAVILAGFGFVLWFSGPSKTAARRGYDVVFTGSVAGLSRGGAVTFNGLRVGDVTHLGLNPADPGEVIAHIDVDKNTPVKIDTRARLEMSGLTGVASLALYGGSPSAKALELQPSESYPTLRADPSQFQSLIETGQRLADQLGAFVDRANKLLDSNSSDINKTVANVKTFTDALAGNSGDMGSLISNLNSSARKFDTAMDNVNGLLSDSKGEVRKTVVDIGEAARSIRKVAENVDGRLKEIAAGITRFTGPGLRQYEALAVDGRKTLDEINKAVRSIKRDPSQVIFGGKPDLPEYRGR